jgi:putative DNA primase/helicase
MKPTPREGDSLKGRRRTGPPAFTFSPEAFRSAMLAAGITPPDDIEADGKKHRFSTNGKGGDDAGEYRVYADSVPSGYFKDYRTGEYHPWRMDIRRELTAQERAEHAKRTEALKRQREKDQSMERAEAARLAVAAWEGAGEAPADHPYSYGLRVYSAARQGQLRTGGKDGPLDCDGALIVPFRDAAGQLSTVEFFRATGARQVTAGLVAGAACSSATSAKRRTLAGAHGADSDGSR